MKIHKLCQSGGLIFALGFTALPVFALTVSSQIEVACRHSELRGTTAIKPEGIVLDSVYQNQCRSGFGSDIYAANDTVELQLSGWLEHSYFRDSSEMIDSELRWLWQSSYLRWTVMDGLAISLGASNHQQGPGYAWNPSNPFFDIRLNERDSAIPFRRDADPMMAVSYTDDFGSWHFMAIDHAAFPLDYAQRGQNRYSYLLTRKQLFSSSELSVNLASVESAPFISLAWVWTATDQLAVHGEFSLREGRKTPSFGALEVAPGAWLSQYQIQNDQEHYHNAMLGFQYTFGNNVNLIIEYFYQDDAYSKTEWQDLQSEIIRQNEQFNSQILPEASLGFLLISHQWLRLLHREYLFARVAFPNLFNDGELAIFARHNIVDSSYIMGAKFEMPLSDHFTLQLSYQTNQGDDMSEAYWIPLSDEAALNIGYKF